MINTSNSSSSSLNNYNNNSNSKYLLPGLKIKTNELFYKWLSQSNRYEQLNEAINYIKLNNKPPRLNELKSFRNDDKSFNNDSFSNNDKHQMFGHYNNHPAHLANSTSNHVHAQSQLNQNYPQNNLESHSLYHNNNNSSSTSSSSSSNNSSSITNGKHGSGGGAPSNQINLNVQNHRSKSPPTLQSPPMSPISRMPLSPKSPRQRGHITNSYINHPQLQATYQSQQQPTSQNQQQSQKNSATLSFNKDQRSQSPTSGPVSVRDLANDKYSSVNNNSNNNLAGSANTTNNNLKITTSSSSTSPAQTNKSNSSAPLSNAKQTTTTQTATTTTATTTPNVASQTNKQSPTQSSKNDKDSIVQRILSNNEATLVQQQQQQSPISANKTKQSDKQDITIIDRNNQLLNKLAAESSSASSPSSSTGLSLIKDKLGLNNNNNLNTSNNNNNSGLSSPTSHQLNHSSLKNLGKSMSVPQFYFPHGKSDDKQFRSIDDVENMKLISAEFKSKKDGKIFKDEFEQITKMLGLPRFWKILLFRACTLNSKLNYVTYSVLEQVWSKLTSNCFERVPLFMKLISNNNVIVYEDWEPLLQDIVDTHPGLKFLHDHKEFHTRYIKTVIARIFYTVNRSWSGRITSAELKRSNFLDVLESLEYEDDINLIKDYFSYEHFYVIYCKFWELDKDHDLYISKEDLYRHNNFAISPRVIDRIFNGTVIRSKDWREGLMSYYDFVWFLISEEDKRCVTSIEYWFRVLDLDGDGVLSMYELEYFYNEQIEQMKDRQIEFMPFTDLLCQMLDLVKPTETGKIRLKDLKQCKMANVFFDTFINLEKYLEYEQRDPFSNMRDLDNPDQSDWDKYAAEEYENLVSEDVNGDGQEMYNNYEEDFEDEPMLFNNQSPNGNGANANNNATTNGNNGTTSNQNGIY